MTTTNADLLHRQSMMTSDDHTRHASRLCGEMFDFEFGSKEHIEMFKAVGPAIIAAGVADFNSGIMAGVFAEFTEAVEGLTSALAESYANLTGATTAISISIDEYKQQYADTGEAAEESMTELADAIKSSIKSFVAEHEDGNVKMRETLEDAAKMIVRELAADD